MLVELPLTWYSANGGFWGMSPGYDVPNHQDFRRRVSESCLFCHNGYSAAARGGMAEGIDCQRCHGPGEKHVTAAEAAASSKAIRGAIVNPARLSPARQMEVCLQCHLETTSRPLPNMLRRYDRPAFSYVPGEPLADYAIHFDHVRGTGHDDKFEINSSAYRFRKSRCFVESKDALVCTTCHNPHQVPRGAAAERHYNGICLRCHSSALEAAVAANRHPAAQECTRCHMPRRRAEDAAAVVMTDHWIQRRPQDRDLTAKIDKLETAKRNTYTGSVELYYPADLSDTPLNRLYLAVAQIKEFSNLERGIVLLEKALAEVAPSRGEFYLDLAEACRRAGQPQKAIAYYEEAIRRDPNLGKAHNELGELLLRSGETSRAIAALERGMKSVSDTDILTTLGVGYGQISRIEESVRLLSRAVQLDPDHPMAWLNLGVSLEHKHDLRAAENAYRAAIRIQPDFVRAHTHLANLLAALGDSPQSAYHKALAKR